VVDVHSLLLHPRSPLRSALPGRNSAGTPHPLRGGKSTAQPSAALPLYGCGVPLAGKGEGPLSRRLKTRVHTNPGQCVAKRNARGLLLKAFLQPPQTNTQAPKCGEAPPHGNRYSAPGRKLLDFAGTSNQQLPPSQMGKDPFGDQGKRFSFSTGTALFLWQDQRKRGVHPLANGHLQKSRGVSPSALRQQKYYVNSYRGRTRR